MFGCGMFGPQLLTPAAAAEAWESALTKRLLAALLPTKEGLRRRVSPSHRVIIVPRLLLEVFCYLSGTLQSSFTNAATT